MGSRSDDELIDALREGQLLGCWTWTTERDDYSGHIVLATVVAGDRLFELKIPGTSKRAPKCHWPAEDGKPVCRARSVLVTTDAARVSCANCYGHLEGDPYGPLSEPAR
jgi:hypothetical protein